MAKDPAFLFYSADFMMGAMTLSMEQRGQYITLLSIMHQKGRLSKEEVEFVIGGTPCIALTKKFKIDDGGNWYNERLELEIAKRNEFTKSRRKSLEIDNGDMVHLYLITDPENGNTKIGSSKYPELRLKEAKKYKPLAEFVWISDALFERKNEKFLHEEFAEKKVRYDWFNLSKKDIENIRTKYCDSSRTNLRTVNENRNGNGNLNGINLKKESLSKIEVFNALFDDELFIADLESVHKGKSFNQAFEQCWIHWSNAKNPPTETGEWKQKLNAWLINMQPGNHKQILKDLTIEEIDKP